MDLVWENQNVCLREDGLLYEVVPIVRQDSMVGLNLQTVQLASDSVHVTVDIYIYN